MHSCDNFKKQATTSDHSIDWDDKIIYYCDKFDEYGIIIHDGGHSWIEIDFCPWCGVKFPNSKRDLWFKTLEDLGFEEFDSDKIPAKFRTSEWYAKK